MDGLFVCEIVRIAREVSFFCPGAQYINNDKTQEDENAELGKENTLEDPDHELCHVCGMTHKAIRSGIDYTTVCQV